MQGQWDTTEIIHQINELKRKQYVAGNTYNGVALTVTGANWTTTRAVFVPYKTIDGAWRLIINVHGTLSAGAASITLTIAGIVFKNGADQSGPCYTASGDINHTRFLNNTATMTMYSNAGRATWFGSGDVELDSKPTWAD